jgi:hypothetical protein
MHAPHQFDNYLDIRVLQQILPARGNRSSRGLDIAGLGGVADDDSFDGEFRADAFHEQDTVIREVFVNPGADVSQSRETNMDLLHFGVFEGGRISRGASSGVEPPFD